MNISRAAGGRQHPLPMGIVTQVDLSRVFVWTKEHPLKELCFPVDQGPNQPEPGTFVRYMAVRSPDHLQYDGVLEKVENPPRSSRIIREPGSPADEYKVLVHIGFPPPGSTHFLREIAQAEDYTIQFYCHSVEFGTVVSFEDHDYRWDKMYKAIVYRFPQDLNWMISRVGTMWAVSSKPLKEITDPVELERVSALMPWNNETNVGIGDGNGNQVNTSHTNHMATSSNAPTITYAAVQEADLLGIDTNIPPHQHVSLGSVFSDGQKNLSSAEAFPLFNKANSTDLHGTGSCGLTLFDRLAISSKSNSNAPPPATPFNTPHIGPPNVFNHANLGHQSSYSIVRNTESNNDFGDAIRCSNQFASIAQKQQYNMRETPATGNVTVDDGSSRRSNNTSLAETGNRVASLLSELKTKQMHKEAAELERKIFELCIRMESDVTGTGGV